MTARIGQFNGRAEIGTAAGLRQCPAEVEHPWARDRAVLQQVRDRVVGPARLTNGREPRHQAVTKVS